MRENAKITLKTIQYAFDGGEDKIELVTKGRYAKYDEKYYIIYEESELTGFENTTTTIKVAKDAVTLSRRGRFNSKMEFLRDEKRLCNYPTPYGMIPVAVQPVRINSSLSEKGGRLELEYILDISNKAYAKNKLELRVEVC